MEVPQRGTGAEPWWGLEARYAYTTCSGQTYFRDVFIEDIWCTFSLVRSLLPPPYSSKKLFEFVQISRPTLAKIGWAPCSTVATPLLSAQQLDIEHNYRAYSVPETSAVPDCDYLCFFISGLLT